MLLSAMIKVLVVSGLLLGYYWLFLRNRRQHQFNRFFLLAVGVVAVLAAFVKIDWVIRDSELIQQSGIDLLPLVASDWREASPVLAPATTTRLNWQGLLFLVYAAGCLVSFARFLQSIRRLQNMKKTAEPVQYLSYRLYMTDSPTAPAVYFSTLFWPRDIDPAGNFSQQILKHEQYHIQQKHGWDLLITELLGVLIWFCPFIHIARKELQLVHEFAADAFAAETGAELGYAEQLLEQHITRSKLRLAISFSQPPLKRRVTMLLQHRKKSIYVKIACWLALPVAALVFLSMTVRPQTRFSSATLKAPRATIVVDAGHGGPDAGAVVGELQEKDISLALVKAIAAEAKNYNLDIVLTRHDDALPGGTTDIASALRKRSEMGNATNASLFLSIHVDNAQDEHASVFIPSGRNGREDLSLIPACTAAGTAVVKSMSAVITTRPALQQRFDKGIWVLDNSTIPSVLIECGSLAQASDKAILTDPVGQQKLAKAILAGVQQYVAAH